LNKELRLQGEASSEEERKDFQRDLQEDFRTGVHEASNRDVQRVAESGELDLVEGSAPFRVGNQGLDIVESDKEPIWHKTSRKQEHW
jgi:hypothetical protein